MIFSTQSQWREAFRRRRIDVKFQVAPSAPPPAAFRKDGWYVVAGGLGGLGQAIIHWMADLGARNIIALSRSGRSNVKSVKFADSIARAGINLHIESIDVTDAAQVRSILELTGGKPISGIIQGAMVLNVGPFQQATAAAIDNYPRTAQWIQCPTSSGETRLVRKSKVP